jgi:hypothetical protein
MKVTCKMPEPTLPNAVIELTPTEVSRLMYILCRHEGRGHRDGNSEITDSIVQNGIGDRLYTALTRLGFTSNNEGQYRP